MFNGLAMGTVWVCVCVLKRFGNAFGLWGACVCVCLPCLENWMSYKHAHHSKCVAWAEMCPMVSWAVTAECRVKHTCHRWELSAPTSSPEKFWLLGNRLCTPHIHVPCDVLAFMQCRSTNHFSISLYAVGYLSGCVLHTWPDTWNWERRNGISENTVYSNIYSPAISFKPVALVTQVISSIGSQKIWTITLLHSLLSFLEMQFFSSCCYAMACRCELLICNYNCRSHCRSFGWPPGC